MIQAHVLFDFVEYYTVHPLSLLQLLSEINTAGSIFLQQEQKWNSHLVYIYVEDWSQDINKFKDTFY